MNSDSPASSTETQPTLYEKLLGETARVSWPELERLFAAGRVLRVAASLDLIEAASAIAEDRAEDMKAWMAKDRVGLLDDETAQRWAGNADCDLWGVVVRPWVLVQER